MKTILVSIDFSNASENAMHFAGKFAQVTNSSILLLYTYQIPVSLNDAPIMMIPEEELKKNSEINLERAKELITKNFPEVPVSTESRLGDVIDELNDVCNVNKPFVIIIGKHKTKGVERFVFGNMDMAIIRHATIPVISVPEIYLQHEIENAAFASDGSEKPSHLQLIKELIELINAKLHCIHVQTSEKEKDIHINSILPELKPNCEIIKDEEFTHGMQSFLSLHEIDLLILIPHKHNIVERLFYKTHTATILEKLTIPVMCIPY